MDKTGKLRAKIREGLKDLVSITDKAKRSEEYKRYLSFVAKFHGYSYGNIFLILSQCPGARMVKGYKQWQKIGRQVQKGEKAISILAPQKYKKRDENGNILKDKDGDVKYGIWFKTVHVFDVSQTDGEPVPELKWRKDSNSRSDILERLEKYAEDQDIDISYNGIKQNGISYQDERRIEIKDSLSIDAKCLTLVHELTHNLFHHDGKPKGQKELEAESTAYVVNKALGLENEKSGFYLAEWSESDSDKIKDILDSICKYSNKILEGSE